jgi:hypothetical protein
LTGDALTAATDQIKKMANPGELVRSRLESFGKINELTEALKGAIKIPGKDAKPEEIKAFHTALGVPETAEAYKLPERPEAMGARTAEDVAVLKPFQETFHKLGMSQDQVAGVVAAYDAYELQVRGAGAAASKAYDKVAETELRTHFVTPQAYDGGLEVANRVLQASLGKYMPEAAERQDFLNATFADGRKLGSHPGFVKFIHDVGMGLVPPVGDGGQLISGEAVGGVDIDKRISEIVKLAHTGKPNDEAEYKRLQPDLERLMAEKNRRAARR